jgi:hypothetical protein
MSSLTGPNRALLIPAPPKCASQTLVALLSHHCDAAVQRHKSTAGFGHLLLDVPRRSRFERLRRLIGLQRQPARQLIYGHYPASENNLKHLQRRYIPAAVVMPIRPIGALICSLIHHTRCKSYGPLDHRCPGLIDGIPGFHQRTETNLFKLLGVTYLPQLHQLIRSWLEIATKNKISLIYVPFQSITNAQHELLTTIDQLLPHDYRSKKQPRTSANDVKINISKTRKIKTSDIGENERTAIYAIAMDLLGCDDRLGPLLPYLLSDLQPFEKESKTPILWEWKQGFRSYEAHI